MTVGIVIVSHSAALAAGVVEVAAAMAPDVVLVAAGGFDGGLGTDLDAVTDGIAAAQGGDGVVLLYDIGSAKMVADLAVEMLGDPEQAAVVDAPLVEGAVAAAVAAQGGATLDEVLSAAASALNLKDVEQVDGVELTLVEDLHARPAGLLARSLADLDAAVTVTHNTRSVDARSPLALMSLNAQTGDHIALAATGPDADEALQRTKSLVERGFA
ncbi:dihydroxyacetone kinase phosphoryl donor subunit DhaM [Actinokineospora cianjurensis]|uniref:phosphoenolpyruvate--glycerone phosphotransferase n=1 Tax=Actinokineospora cianjurensis TaxID=585224 RepID=A0A421BA57_9PSEU|nr:dihydroxyacetone kinase phosphoryl donor subunit DhaM [Actinokineospora cianjurensis]RLK61442.1 phosphocarrier protein HPr /dihydroxyacetone kinase DhaM subunit [Actinokineospora cianjurensis]